MPRETNFDAVWSCFQAKGENSHGMSCLFSGQWRQIFIEYQDMLFWPGKAIIMQCQVLFLGHGRQFSRRLL